MRHALPGRIGLGFGVALLMALAPRTSAAEAGQMVYTPKKAPEAPKVAEMEHRKSVSQYGITWTFEEAVPVGRFVNGDYYVVGPVAVVGIDPKPLVGDAVPESELDERGEAETPVRNGSMLNPPAAQRVAYDSGIRNWFRFELLDVPPINMEPGDSLVSTTSLKQGERVDYPYHPGSARGRGDNSPVKTAAVLTCMAEPQPADAFRPAFCDTENHVYLSRNLQRELLYNLPRPPEGIVLSSGPSDLDFWVRVFQRPWVNTGFFGFDQPMANMPQYGQWVGQAQSVGGLMLMLDYPPEQKENLLVNMVQVGIDYWGAVKNGHPGWEGWGGHASGRKFPIVLAGILLGDEEMASPTSSFPDVNFGEDNQTMHGEGWTGAKALFAGHSGIHADGSIPRPKWGPYEHLHPSEWDKNGMRNFQSDAYRRANTSSSWVGQALVMRMLRAEDEWNHDAFFDYVDRWMTEDDSEHRKIISEHFPRAQLGKGHWWNKQGNAWEPFAKTMWDRYRNDLPAARR